MNFFFPPTYSLPPKISQQTTSFLLLLFQLVILIRNAYQLLLKSYIDSLRSKLIIFLPIFFTMPYLKSGSELLETDVKYLSITQGFTIPPSPPPLHPQKHINYMEETNEMLTWERLLQNCLKAPRQLISLVLSSSGVSINILIQIRKLYISTTPKEEHK